MVKNQFDAAGDGYAPILQRGIDLTCLSNKLTGLGRPDIALFDRDGSSLINADLPA